MSLIFNVIRAGHARGTHHKLALDALHHVTGPDADAWRRVFLKHAALYVQGAKAPDDEFKDFQNHVMHVRDGYWGGAADKVESWYGHLVSALQGQRWSEAVWAAGVLSHYYTDPIHPFHTGQSEAENSIHRACEWSISRSYDALLRQGEQMAAAGAVKGPEARRGEGWLRDLVVQGAETGNRQYEKLIAHYDVNRGVVEPPEGLDTVSRRLVAELIAYATRGFAAVLGRAIAEANATPPQVSLTLEGILATLRVPLNRIIARLEDAAERRAVEAMYDELKATGRVERTLPEDERVLREAYDREVMARQLAQRTGQRSEVVAQPPAEVRRQAALAAIRQGRQAAVPPAPAGDMEAAARRVGAPSGPAPTAHVGPPHSTLRQASEAPTLAALSRAQPSAPAFTQPPRAAAPVSFMDAAGRVARPFLQAADDVERAPSIGPKTADRLYAIGVKTVADLLAGDADDIAVKLDLKHVWTETVQDWQAQSRLMMAVPGLRGGPAQLLVGAGYRDAKALAEAIPNDVLVAVLKFARTPEGERILRDGTPPDLEKVMAWVANAAAARAA